MQKLKYMWVTVLAALILWGCSDSSTNPTDEVEEASAEKQFVWNAMNYWYYWQGDVPELADNHFENDQAFYEYLNGFSNAEAVFNALKYEQEDDFSFFIDDYETFQQSQQGISKSFGFEFGLVRFSQNSNDIFGYVQYVLPETPANDAGLVRGNLFTKVDGTQLTVNNYQDLLLSKTSYQLSLASIQDNTISETGETVDLQAVTIQEDPVFISKVLEEGNTKIGYLMYNAFQTNSHQELNEVFGTFVSEGIEELVVDLRYNGGGTGITAQALAGMISGMDGSNEFATYSYNSKRSAQWNRTVSILDQVPIYQDGEKQSDEMMNQLSVDRAYFLVGSGTASASELLINALKPYMDIILVGEQTTGKDEGSYTLYDAPEPYLEEKNANPSHKYAIQPIVLKLVNKNDEGYPDGFIPEYQVNELSYLDDLPPLGDKNDPLLAKALELITGEPPAKISTSTADYFPGNMFIDSRDLRPYGKQLYLQPPDQSSN